MTNTAAAPDTALTPAGSWAQKTIRLKQKFAGFGVFSVRFPALLLDLHLTEAATPPLPPEGGFPPGVEAALVRMFPLSGPLPRLSRVAGAIRYVTPEYPRYYIDLRGSFAEYLKKFSGKSRSTLQRKVRKFAEFSGGAALWREYRKPEEVAEFRRMAREVSTRTYQEKLYDYGIPDSDAYWEKMEAFAAEDLLRGFILFHGERPIAYLCCPATGGALDYQYLGYDPEYKSWSPGDVLQFLALESLFAEGRFELFDFGEGAGQHKEFFATGHSRCVDIYYFRRTWRNGLLIALHAGIRVASELTLKALEAVRVKHILKKRLRAGKTKA